jgi:predicted ATPase
MAAIASVGSPLVILIDDVQWADISSLDLLQSLLLYPSTHQEQQSQTSSFLVILAYRDDYGTNIGDALGEYSPSFQVPAFAAYLRRLVLQGQNQTLRITEIALGNLNPAFVNELLAGHLQLSSHETFSLTQVVYNNTHGNVFHVLQYLAVLMDQGFLRQDNEGRWTWNYRELESQAAVSETVVDLVQYKLDQLPPVVLDALKVASCMGNEIDDDALSFVLGTNEISKHLSFAEQQGLIVMVPESGRYRFAHDRILQVAFALIEDPQAVCLKIGRALLKASNPTSLEGNIFVLVNLFNQGSAAIEDSRERFQVANLNLLAGEKAIVLSAFPDASRYLKQGIDLIRDDQGSHWETYYELSLRLFESFAEAEVCNQNFSRVRELINEGNFKIWSECYRLDVCLSNTCGGVGP